MSFSIRTLKRYKKWSKKKKKFIPANPVKRCSICHGRAHKVKAGQIFKEVVHA